MTGRSESNGYRREHSSCAEGSPSEIGVLWTVTNSRQRGLCGSATQAWKHKPINPPKSCDSRNFSNDFWVDFAWTSVGGQNFVCTVTCIVWKPPPRAKNSQDVHVGIDLLLFFFFTGHTYPEVLLDMCICMYKSVLSAGQRFPDLLFSESVEASDLKLHHKLTTGKVSRITASFFKKVGISILTRYS